MSKIQNLLIIDDDLIDIITIKKILEPLKNTRLFEASNVDDAMYIIETNEISLVITDIFMPGTDGLELLNTLRKSTYSFPVIAVSGQTTGGANYLDIAKTFGAVTTFQKQELNDKLLNSVMQILLPQN